MKDMPICRCDQCGTAIWTLDERAVVSLPGEREGETWQTWLCRDCEAALPRCRFDGYDGPAGCDAMSTPCRPSDCPFYAAPDEAVS